MTFLIDKNKFKEALGHFSKVCSGRLLTHPVLNCVKIASKSIRDIQIFGTDLDTWIDETINDVEISEPFEFCVNQNKLYSFISTLNNGNIEIKLLDKKNGISIKQNKIKIELPIISATEFPQKLEISGQEIVFETDLLKNNFKKALTCIAEYDANSIISGVNIQADKNKILIASTDGNRLFASSFEHEGELKQFDVTLRSHSVKEFLNIINDKTCKIVFAKNGVVFSTNNINISTLILDGSYPRYQQLIPKDYYKKIRLDRAIFLNSLERLLIVASEKMSEKDGTSFLKMSIKDNMLNLSASKLSYVEDIFEIKADFEKEVALNPKFLLSILSALNDSSFIFEFGESELGSILIKPDDQQECLFLIMPIQVVN